MYCNLFYSKQYNYSMNLTNIPNGNGTHRFPLFNVSVYFFFCKYFPISNVSYKTLLNHMSFKPSYYKTNTN